MLENLLISTFRFHPFAQQYPCRFAALRSEGVSASSEIEAIRGETLDGEHLCVLINLLSHVFVISLI